MGRNKSLQKPESGENISKNKYNDFDIIKNLDKSIEEIESVITNKPFQYSFWITNVGIGLLGFYFALLLKFNDEGIKLLKFLYTIPLSTCLVSIAIGLIVRINNELFDWVKVIKDFIVRVKDLIDSFGEENIIDDERIRDFKDRYREFEKDEKDIFQLYPPVKLILSQLIFFIISLLFILFIIVKYLFL